MSKKAMLIVVLTVSAFLLAGLVGSGLIRATLGVPGAVDMTAEDEALSVESLTVGPSAVIVGNPEGDVTIIEYLDYQCPVCRRVHPDVQALMTADPGIRVIYKHWPIFGDRSVYASRIALAARWQGKYEAVHDALMGASGTLDRDTVRTAAAAAGVDLARLDEDLAARATEIESAIADASIQARLIGMRGTPTFLVGRYLIPGGLDLATLRRIVADVRAGEDTQD